MVERPMVASGAFVAVDGYKGCYKSLAIADSYLLVYLIEESNLIAFDVQSRLSPFANSKVRREKKVGKEDGPRNDAAKSKKFARWFPLIDAATLSKKRVLLPVKKLRDSSSLLSSELHRTLYGFIVFEVAWSDVRGINYLNELQVQIAHFYMRCLLFVEMLYQRCFGSCCRLIHR